MDIIKNLLRILFAAGIVSGTQPEAQIWGFAFARSIIAIIIGSFGWSD